MSFSLRDIASKSSITGWYALLPYSEGRNRYESTSASSSPVNGRRRSQPNVLANGSSLGTKEVKVRSASPPPTDTAPRAAKVTVDVASDSQSGLHKSSPKWQKPGGSKAQLQKQVGGPNCDSRGRLKRRGRLKPRSSRFTLSLFIGGGVAEAISSGHAV